MCFRRVCDIGGSLLRLGDGRDGDRDVHGDAQRQPDGQHLGQQRGQRYDREGGIARKVAWKAGSWDAI